MTRSLRILIADDEPDMRDYFQKLLPRMGYEVVGAAQNGQELVDLNLSLQPDLIITDIKMPLMDGIDAAIRIFQDRPAPIILVSAYHDPELIARAEADHVLSYLVKPIKAADLQTTIALAVHRFAQFQALQQALDDRDKERQQP